MSYLQNAIRRKTAAPTSGDYELAKGTGKLAVFARQNIQEYEAQLAAPVNDLLDKIARTEQERSATELLIRQQELRKKLVTQESPEFRTEPYSDEGLTDEQIRSKCIAAFEEWGKTVQDSDAQMVAQFLQVNYQRADATKVSTFEAALQFINAQFKALEPTPAPVPEVPPAGKFASVVAEIALLKAEADKHPFDSRERNALEKEALALEVKLETLGDQDYQNTMQEICTQSGKSISSAHSMQFRQWLSEKSQVRVYGVKPSVLDMRLAFGQWANDTSFLEPDELKELQRRADIARMTSSEIISQVGKRNTYDPSSQGYRANRGGQ